jgi:alpha-L-fucosidase
VDGDPDSYWSPSGQASTGELDLDLGRPTTFDVVGVQEPIRHGQRVSSFAVDVWDGTGWTQVASGSTIGYKRLIRFAAPVTAQKVRLRILGARAAPMISTVSLYQEPTT